MNGILGKSCKNFCEENGRISRLNDLSRKLEKLEMWANAQPDGRPAEYR